MTEFLSDRMPKACVEAFDGHDLEHKLTDAYPVLSTDPDGAPRVCMLSAGEILAVDDRTLRLALWEGTHSAANLGRNPRVVICFVAPHTVLYIRGTPRRLAASPEARLERFEIRVERVDSDEHEGMPVSHGIKVSAEARTSASVLEHSRKTLQGLGEARYET